LDDGGVRLAWQWRRGGKGGIGQRAWEGRGRAVTHRRCLFSKGTRPWRFQKYLISSTPPSECAPSLPSPITHHQGELGCLASASLSLPHHRLTTPRACSHPGACCCSLSLTQHLAQHHPDYARRPETFSSWRLGPTASDTHSHTHTAPSHWSRRVCQSVLQHECTATPTWFTYFVLRPTRRL
jgi:hypothetical protein